MTESTIPVTMSLPRNLVTLLDNAADADGRSRSAMARRILAGALADAAAADGASDTPNDAADTAPLVPQSFLDGLHRRPSMSNDAEMKAAQARALAEAIAADAACRLAAQQSALQRAPQKETK